MSKHHVRRVLATGLLVPLLSGVTAATSVTAASAVSAPDNACAPGPERVVGQSGAFTASSSGKGQGETTFDDNLGHETTGPGSINWQIQQQVTGNAGANHAASPGTLWGTLSLSVAQSDGTTVQFTTTCILEAGVFQGTEEDPLPPETNRTVSRGIEGEWEGTAYNFPGPGMTSNVVASLAVWRPVGGVAPRFHLDMTTGPCTNEVDPSLTVAGPSGSPEVSAAQFSAPPKEAGRGVCNAA